MSFKIRQQKAAVQPKHSQIKSDVDIIDWEAETDRELVLCSLMKAADIGHPVRMSSLHLRWTRAITDEFFAQVFFIH